MTSRERDCRRKYESGAEKAKKRKIREELQEKDKGSLDKFVSRLARKECANDESLSNLNQVQKETTDCDDLVSEENNEVVQPVNIYDPGNWENLNLQDITDILIKSGPIKILNDECSFSRNKDNRHFSDQFYKRVLSNGEVHERQWLMYSIKLDRVFCFCCKLFGIIRLGNLSDKGFNDWKHLHT